MRLLTAIPWAPDACGRDDGGQSARTGGCSTSKMEERERERSDQVVDQSEFGLNQSKRELAQLKWVIICNYNALRFLIFGDQILFGGYRFFFFSWYHVEITYIELRFKCWAVHCCGHWFWVACHQFPVNAGGLPIWRVQPQWRLYLATPPKSTMLMWTVQE